MLAAAAAEASRPGFLPSWWGPHVFGPALGLVLVLIVAGRVLMRRPPKVRAVHEAGRVVGFLGRMGSGKTYAAVRAAHQNLAAGCDVYTNFTMHLRHEDGCPADCDLPVLEGAGRWHRIASMDEVGSIRGEFEVVRGRKRCTRRFVLILDEVQDLLSSDHGGLSDTARFTIKNIRKFGGDMYWTSQSEGGVHSRLKLLTNQYAVCASYRKGKGRAFSATYYDSEDLRKKGRELFTAKYRFEPLIGDLYDTSEIVVPEDDYVDERLRVVLDATGVGAPGRGAARGTRAAARSGPGRARQAKQTHTQTLTPRPDAASVLVVGGPSEVWRRGVGIHVPEPPTS